jgi:hypothetical protein
VDAVKQLTELAHAKGATVSQLALAWILAQGQDIVPIPGTRSAARVAENTAAADLTLAPADLEEIARILPAGGFGAATRTAGFLPGPDRLEGRDGCRQAPHTMRVGRSRDPALQAAVSLTPAALLAITVAFGGN